MFDLSLSATIVAIVICIIITISVYRCIWPKQRNLDHEVYSCYCQGYDEGFKSGESLKQ